MRKIFKSRKWPVFLCIVLLITAAALGYWKRRGIRNTIMRYLEIELPRTTKAYGYYGQAVKTDADIRYAVNIEENDAAAQRFVSNIPLQESLVSSALAIDREITEELENGDYSFEEPMVLLDPYQISPLTGVILFHTEQELSVRCTVKGKTQEADVSYETGAQKEHRVPLVGLYPARENTVVLELIGTDKEILQTTELKMDVDGLPEKMDRMVVPVKTSGSSAFGLTMVYGQNCNYPFAYDCNGDIRWFLNKKCGNYGIFSMSEGTFLLQDPRSLTPSGEKPQTTDFYEMDYLGRAYRLYCFPQGCHHEVIEKEPGGNLLILTSSLRQHFEDTITEIDRESGLPVNTLDLLDLFPNTFTRKFDWAHINTVSYNAQDDTILISPRNLHSAMKIGWTDHKLRWILADPYFWKDTKYSKYVLAPETDFMWHYKQHTTYIVDADLDSDPATVEISFFDNHKDNGRRVATYTDTGMSYVTVYSVNEAAGTVSLLKQLEVLRSGICSNTIYDPQSGHIFGMCGIVKNPDLEAYRALNYEFDYETGALINQYAIRDTFYRSTQMVIDTSFMENPVSSPENYITGQLPAPAAVKAKVPESAGLLTEGVDLTQRGSVLFFRALDHHISQVILKGEKHTYVYDTTKIKQEFKRYMKYTGNMPLTLCGLAADEYRLLCVYKDTLYDLQVDGEPAGIRVLPARDKAGQEP